MKKLGLMGTIICALTGGAGKTGRGVMTKTGVAARHGSTLTGEQQKTRKARNKAAAKARRANRGK